MTRLRSFAHSIKGWWKHDPWSTPGRILRGSWNILMFPFREKATREIADLRVNCCIDCPIHDPIHNTCGDMVDGETYVHPITGKVLPLGCGCDIGMKTEIASANCWLYERGQDGGWDRKLNGSEH